MSTALASLIAACSPLVHPATMQALISVESAGNPYAVSINRPSAWRRSGAELPAFDQPRSETQARDLVEALSAAGYTTSVGLAQINTENLRGLRLSVSALLNPCVNLYVAQQILVACDASTLPTRLAIPSTHLHAVLSCFNSGNATTGIRNGYAGRVRSAALLLATNPLNRRSDQ